MLTRRQFLSALGLGAAAPVWSNSTWAGTKKRVIVVGGGLSGLTAAWRLALAGVEVEVIGRRGFSVVVRPLPKGLEYDKAKAPRPRPEMTDGKGAEA